MPAQEKVVKTEQVVLLTDTQIRCRISKKTVDSYAEQIREGVKFPPVDVFIDAEGRYILGDGHHRFLASQQNGAEQIRILIHECKPEEAITRALERAITMNALHGLFLSREDRRNAVKMILKDTILRRKGDSPIAKMVGVSPGTVADVRRELAGDSKKKRDVEVSSHKRSAPGPSAPDLGTDPLQERINTLRGWVDSGLVEWKDVQQIFTSASHVPMLVPRKPHHVVLVKDDGKQAKIWVSRVSQGKSGDETVLVLHGIKKAEATA